MGSTAIVPAEAREQSQERRERAELAGGQRPAEPLRLRPISPSLRWWCRHNAAMGQGGRRASQAR